MNRDVPVEVLPPEKPIFRGKKPQPPTAPRFSRRRLALAFTVAALADAVSLFLTFTPPVQWAADLVTAVVLFAILGRQWVLLPGLIMEAIPGLSIFPFWIIVVGAAAMWGKPSGSDAKAKK
jgi:hypothetical protein